ncbi:MAG: SpoIIE family protein phosphatase [Spirochaetes bacterium]|nr:SpoIIE family protein phosphatase [Spirochaetota bacterium]
MPATPATGSSRRRIVNFNLLCGALAVAFLCRTAPAGAAAEGITKLSASRGLLDLAGWDFSVRGIVKLDGQWEFHWGRLLEPGDFAGPGAPVEPEYLRVPGTWNSRESGGLHQAEGFGTYRLRVRMPPGERVMGIYLRTVSTSYRMWINGTLRASSGIVGTDGASSHPRYYPLAVPFTQDGGTLEIVCQVSNFVYRKGGMWNAPLLGEISDLRDRLKEKLLVDLFIIGSLVIMGLYHLILFAARRRTVSRDYSPLFFGLACLVIPLRMLASGNYLITYLFPGLGFEWVLTMEFATMTLPGIFLFQFARALYPEEFGHAIAAAVTWTLGTFTAAVVLLPVRVFNRAAVPIEFIILAVGCYAVYALALAFYRRREDAGLMIAGVVVIVAVIVNDMLFSNRIIHTGDFTAFGIFTFTFLQSVILARRFSRSFVKNEELTGRLDGYARDLEQKNLALENMDRLKDEFMANTSHELRTPLTGIIGIAESIIDGSGRDLPAEALHNLSMIVSSGKRLSSLINDILDFSRMKNGELVLSPGPVDLYLSADQVVAFSRALCAGRDLTLRNAVPADFPPVWADGDRLQQVLFNLVGNAIKFTPLGSVEVGATVAGAMAAVTVCDTGIGIPPEKLESIFIPFEQGDSSMTRQFGGTGLGLPISRQLAELHGGTLTAASEPGKGSVFTVTVPLAGDRASAEPRRAALEAPAMPGPAEDVYAPAEGGRFDVMVVDDEPVNVQVLVNHLRNAGFTVAAAPGGAEALQILERARPDLVVLDVMMPALSGYDVCREIRRRFAPYEMPVLLLTAKNRINDIVIGFESGANDYLPKPFDKRELLARVNTLVSLKRTVEENRRLLVIEHELDIARRIQNSLLPERLPEVPSLTLRAYFKPMQRVGGDIYDFIQRDPGGLGMLIADVAGHGIPAALISSMVKMAFSLQRIPLQDTAGMLSSLNGALAGKCGYRFVTAGYAYIDAAAGRLFYSKAGHHPALVCRGRDRSVESLSPHGRIMALFDSIDAEAAECPLEPGDTVLLFTDGLVECAGTGGEMFGMNRVMDLLRRHSPGGPDEMVDSLVEAIRAWRGNDDFDDDVTMVAARYGP